MAFTVSPLLLAAGQSTRFGSDKLLHPFSYDGATKSLILHTIQLWLSQFPSLTIVIRPDNQALITLLKNSPYWSRLTLINSVNAERGMSASLISGIKATQHADCWLIGLGDMPFIHKTVIQQSSETLNNGAQITQGEFRGKRGHPVGFSSRFLPDLLSLQGDKGAREVLHRFPEIITLIPSPDNGIFRDIDDKSDL